MCDASPHDLDIWLPLRLRVFPSKTHTQKKEPPLLHQAAFGDGRACSSLCDGFGLRSKGPKEKLRTRQRCNVQPGGQPLLSPQTLGL